MPTEKFIGDPASLRAWQERMGFTYETAAQALGMSRSAYAAMLAGDVARLKDKSKIDLRTALACAAVERKLKPFNERS